MNTERFQIRIEGRVQGVGFRPHIYKTAKKLNLTGWVKNTCSGVMLEVQGKLAFKFIDKLNHELPILAKIDDLNLNEIPLSNKEYCFEILESLPGKNKTKISPDISVCGNCLKELFDPNSRYFKYPFLNCVNCGPRLSITYSLPYDRCKTSMNKFSLCKECNLDYIDPDNRRFHAQPTACKTCGPVLTSTIKKIAMHIQDGKIVAIKSLGGYQLICDARNEKVIDKLRKRKNRPSKPFAIMAENIKTARTISELDDNAAEILQDYTKPILLLKKSNKELPENIAPGLSDIGIMLPNTPLHYLLFNELRDSSQTPILIVTSANSSDSSIIADDIIAKTELAYIADKTISYNRKIVSRIDDSVIKIINHAPAFIRRARGYAPNPIELQHEIPPTLGLGCHAKNTFCITRGKEAFLSQHIGDLDNKKTIEFYHETLNHYLKLLDVKPERIAYDMHPNFYTSLYANKFKTQTFKIQHHHAHLTSVAAEHQIQGKYLGLALDGFGYGSDGSAWGGELLLLEDTTYKRLGSFKPFLQPGGDIAIREPWRMAASVFYSLGKGTEIARRFFNRNQSKLLYDVLDKKINCIFTSSCGRLFDAVSAMLGIQEISEYDSHAASRLESFVTQPEVLTNGWNLCEKYFDMSPTLDFLINTTNKQLGANIFHGTLNSGLTSWIKLKAKESNIDKIALSGGCFLNKILMEGLFNELTKNNLKVFTPKNLPANDGGVSLGQAWIAGRL